MGRMLIVYYSLSNGNTRRIVRELQRAAGADLAEFLTVRPYTGTYQEIVDQGARSFRAVVTLKGSGEDTVWTDVRTVEEWETVSVLEELGMDELAQLAQAGEALPVVWQMPEGNELLADYCQGAGLSLTTAGSSSKFS